MLGREDEALRIRAKNPAFKERFNEAFWIEREGLFALGLDSNGRQIASVASNAGHTLGTGIAFPDKAASTINRLFEPDMFSGWGVRTLSSLHPAYNPYSYHRGSVWPVEQGAFAIGCRRYKHNDHLLKLSKAHFELARLFEHFRLPEVLSGHPRDELHPFPSLYPDTNSPQAWSASATYAILYSILGLLPYAALNVLFVDPQLPCWLPEISVSNLRVGDSVISLRFVRQADGTTDYNVLDLQGKIEIRRCEDPWSLVGLPARELRERTVA
jgi:glycogen debranching enzyme